MDASVAVATFTSPVILFFILGLLAAFARSELAVPEAIAKAMSLYLMAAIGLKGGVAVANRGSTVRSLPRSFSESPPASPSRCWRSGRCACWRGSTGSMQAR